MDADIILDETGAGIAYRILPDDGDWMAFQLRGEAIYPLGRYGTPQAALDACRADTRRRHADDEINTVEAARAKVPLDDREPPEQEG